MQKPCDQCPWRLSNQGKRHKFGFYTKKNLRRLWGEIRGGGTSQSCHLTDPSHPDHIAVGTKPGAKPKECPGSVILVKREIQKMADPVDGVVRDASVKSYLATNKEGLTRHGVLYWVVRRIQLAGVPFLGAAPLPEVDQNDREIGR